MLPAAFGLNAALRPGMIRRMKVAAFAILLAAVPFAAAAKTEKKHSPRPATGEIILPFQLNKEGFPLIKGAVDGKPGVFLLDTGTYDRFLLNRHYVPLDQGVHVGGDESIVLRRHAGAHKADLAGVLKVPASSGNGKNPDAALSIDARQQQQDIDPRFLGWLGWGFFKKYVTTIDYRRQVVRLMPLAKAPPTPRPPESITLSFLPSSPVRPFVASIGGHSTPTVVRTTGWDSLALQPANWKRIAPSKVVKPRPGKGCIAVTPATFGGKRVDLVDLERSERQDERLTLGIGFLPRFTSVWDPRVGKVILTPNGTKPPQRRSCA